MQIKQKPIKVKLTRKGNLIHVSTPFASIEVAEHQFAFVTQGLAYERKAIDLQGPRDLVAKFNSMLNAQFCLSHLQPSISPFLRNYLLNKSNSALNLVSFDSLLEEMKDIKRVLFCGAGPSLYESWDFVEFCLKTGYALVIAGGSAIRAFSNRGLVPNLCLVCDPNPGVASRGEVSSELQKSTILLAGSGVHPGLLSNWNGPIALTNGMSALKMGDYLEPGKKGISEGGIGVSTFVMSLVSEIHGVETLMLLGVDLASSDGKTVYPSDLGFDNAIDRNREHIWKCEAQSLGQQAKLAKHHVYNLSLNGRDIPNIKKVAIAELVDDASNLGPIQLNPLPSETGDFMARLTTAYFDLCKLNLENVYPSPLFKPFVELYHNVLLSRSLYTGEYARDSLILKLQCLKDLIEEIFDNQER